MTAPTIEQNIARLRVKLADHQAKVATANVPAQSIDVADLPAMPAGVDVSERFGLSSGVATTALHPQTGQLSLAVRTQAGDLRYVPRDGGWGGHDVAGTVRMLSALGSSSGGQASAARSYVGQGVHEIAERMRNTEAAKEIIAAEKRAKDVTKPFDAGTIDEILARPAEPEARMAGLIPWEASAIVIAPNKAGKTTFLGNLVRCAITGDPFLGRFEVQPLAGRVAFLNYEVSARTAAWWFRDMGIPSDRFELVNLRGARNPLGHAGDRAVLAERLRRLDVEMVIIDPFANAFTGESQQSNDEVGAFLRDVDSFVREDVGARDAVLAVHAGWGEHVRGRGASAIQDWPDTIITLTKDAEHGDRYMRAFGRDVDVEETVLSFDPTTRHLTMGDGGSRRDVTDKRAIVQVTPAVVEYVLAHPGCSQNIVETEVEGNAGQIRRALASAAAQGLIERAKVAGKWVHNPPRPTSSSLVPDEVK